MPSFGFGHTQPKISPEKIKPTQDLVDLIPKMFAKPEHSSQIKQTDSISNKTPTPLLI